MSTGRRGVLGRNQGAVRNLARAVFVYLLPLLASCTTTTPATTAPPEPDRERSVDRPPDVPEWYLNPPTAGEAMYGIGSAKLAGPDISRRVALARAREDVGFQMHSVIQAAIVETNAQVAVTDTADTNAANRVQVLEFVELISRQVADVTLRHTRPLELYQANDGTIFALVSYRTGEFVDTVAAAFRSNEDAAFAEFQARRALEHLDRALHSPPAAGARR